MKDNLKLVVHRLHSGSPDKINIWTDGSYETKSHDHIDLVDYSESELISIFNNNGYILPADEGDIEHSNKLNLHPHDQSRILLPHINVGEGYCEVIPYDSYVPKNSMVYQSLNDHTDVVYEKFKLIELGTFKHMSVIEINSLFMGRAIKSTTGSGSRGVWLLDPNRVGLGGKYVSELTESQLNNFIAFCERERCKVMIQDLIPNDPKLTKVNVDFVIKEGKLLGYKWDKTDPSAVFTNWNFGWFIRNEYTDKIMDQISQYLINYCGIWNAIMNFEAFSDMESETHLVEFNWRYSNSMFEGQALGIDLIGSYLHGKPFEIPIGEHKFSRYWQCELYENIPSYHEGK